MFNLSFHRALVDHYIAWLRLTGYGYAYNQYHHDCKHTYMMGGEL